MADADAPITISLRDALPRDRIKIVELRGMDEVPTFDTPIDDGHGSTLTIQPPLDECGRGVYVSTVCAPMASKKSFRARTHAWDKGKGITVVVAGRISYALNAMQEWRESVPDAKEQEAAAREAYADYDELVESDRRAAEAFGPEAAHPARVWCYLTHDQKQLDALFRTGFGVCIVSPMFCPTFCNWLLDMPVDARIDQLYVEEVMALAQMWNSKVLHDPKVMYAMRALATKRSRSIFGFCADFLIDDRPTIYMNWLVGDDRPHYVFKVPNARAHMQCKVALCHGTVAEEVNAFEEHYDRLLACMVRQPDFLVLHHVSYEKRCIAMYTRAVALGIRSTLLIGNMDGEDKHRIMTNFDGETRDAQALFATSVFSIGVNSKRQWSAAVAITGPRASGPIVAGQAIGRGGRVNGLECDTILWLILDSEPPKDDETLTPWWNAERKLDQKALYKGRFAMSHRFHREPTPALLRQLAIGNEKEKMDIRSHCALATRTLVEYKPGWTLVDVANIELPLRASAMTPERVKSILETAKPLPDHLVQKIDSLSDVEKMRIGVAELMTLAKAKFEAGDATYDEVVRDVLDTCGGIFAHSHVSGTYQHGVTLDSQQVQMVRAWRVVRHFEGSIDRWKPSQLLEFEKHEDALNLAACHLSMGTRRITLARLLLRSQSDQSNVGLYTRLPERVGALEQACTIVGVSCLAAPRIVLTAGESPFVRLLQRDKMGVPSTEVTDALNELRVIVDVAIGDASTPKYGTKTLYDALRSLLHAIHSVVVVAEDRRMAASECTEWEAHNECADGPLAGAVRVSGALTNEQLDAMLGYSSDEDGEPPAPIDPANAPSSTPKKPKAKTIKDGKSIRLPVTIEIRRKIFRFDSAGVLVTESKASKMDAGAVQEVDVAPLWRVYSAAHGDSWAARRLLGDQTPLANVERELTSLLAGHRCSTERFEVTKEQRNDRIVAAQTIRRANSNDVVTRLTPTVDGDKVIMEEPIPATALASALQRLRKEKRRAQNRLCTPQLLEQYKNAKSKGEKKRLDRRQSEAIKRSFGPKKTTLLQWCEAVDDKASAADAHGLRWLLVEYRVKNGLGRQVSSWPSLQACERELRKELMSPIMHDWDIVSCHFFLCRAVVRGILSLDPSTEIPTIDEYNRACEEDVATGRGKEENTFLKPIAEWYGVSVDEAKLGCLILLNQGTIETWLQKELDPPREGPSQQHDSLTCLMTDAIKMRRLFFEHADTLFGRDAFDALKNKLLREHPHDSSLKTQSGMERSLFGYCLQQLEKEALGIAMDASTACGLPPITRIYDGFGQLHVNGVDPAAFKVAAEAALLAKFKSPILLAEKPFYCPTPCDESESEEEANEEALVPPPPSTSRTGEGHNASEEDTEDETNDEDGDDNQDGADDDEDDEDSGHEMEEADDDIADDGDGSVAEDAESLTSNEARSEDEEPDSQDEGFLSPSDEGSDDDDSGYGMEDANSQDEAVVGSSSDDEGVEEDVQILPRRAAKRARVIADESDNDDEYIR
tara:strand:- start:279 stop:4814 length:4536 start_codon:yes stop_codon:yes gene_type:complete